MMFIINSVCLKKKFSCEYPKVMVRVLSLASVGVRVCALNIIIRFGKIDHNCMGQIFLY